jgi:HEPN domain-containing protein
LSPSPEHVEYAETLLRLADADLYACRVLADAADLADGAVGFHAQQAVEKALKVAIVLAEAELPRNHDLEQLREQVEATGAHLPSELAGVDWLTPWAVALRYDEPTALDRTAALALAESACSWAKALLDT